MASTGMQEQHCEGLGTDSSLPWRAAGSLHQVQGQDLWHPSGLCWGTLGCVPKEPDGRLEVAPVGLVRKVEHRVDSEKATRPTLESLSRDHRCLLAELPLPSPGEGAKALSFICPWFQLPTPALLSRTCLGGGSMCLQA